MIYQDFQFFHRILKIFRNELKNFQFFLANTFKRFCTHIISMKYKEKIILSKLRENSRTNINVLGKAHNISPSTLYDTVKQISRKYVSKEVTLIDFEKFGYNAIIKFIMGAKDKDNFREYLINHRSINSVSVINSNNHDFYFEGIFRNMKEYAKFRETLDQFDITSRMEIIETEKIMHENFLSDCQNME